ncbi:hypothetical protein M8C13_02300 [Crossiella sp. SN42]|uniref:hypothetical protein n=1 Tax=Crossiella sp. SN42 TaxID=2944808 RepID=UPI00207D4A14|nr:hypothetical protein [Crossiella sp. SN42]MCO1574588.1 hypothetical protein [Crossiella sp. SN42]
MSAASPLATALEEAGRTIAEATHRYLDPHRAPGPATACAETWQLIHLLGALGELATALAPQVGAYPRRHLLHAHDGADPTRHLAHACRDLTTLRRALDEARHAAQNVYTALSHLNTLASLDDRGTGPGC